MNNLKYSNKTSLKSLWQRNASSELAQLWRVCYKSRKLSKDFRMSIRSSPLPRNSAESRWQMGATGALGPSFPHLRQVWKAKSSFRNEFPSTAGMKGLGGWGRNESSCFQLLVKSWRLALTSSLPRGRSLTGGELPNLSLAVVLLLFPSGSWHVLSLQPKSIQIDGAPADPGAPNVGMQIRWELGPIREELSKVCLFLLLRGSL